MISMNKMGLLAAAIYSVLEVKRDYPKSPLQDFVVNIDTDPKTEAIGIISGHLMLGTQSQLRKFQISIDADHLTVKITNGKKYFTEDEVSAIFTGELVINFKDRFLQEIVKKDYANINDIEWDWRSVGGTALDVIGIILGEENS